MGLLFGVVISNYGGDLIEWLSFRLSLPVIRWGCVLAIFLRDNCPIQGWLVASYPAAEGEKTFPCRDKMTSHNRATRLGPGSPAQPLPIETRLPLCNWQEIAASL